MRKAWCEKHGEVKGKNVQAISVKVKKSLFFSVHKINYRCYICILQRNKAYQLRRKMKEQSNASII